MSLDVSRDLLRRQLTTIGSSTIGQADCARFIADRKIAVDQLITHRWQLAQTDQACQLFDQQISGKGVFVRP